MEKLGFLVFLITLFLLQFCYPSLVSSDYVFPDKYFINCGSKSNVNDSGSTFVGDVKSGYTAGKSKPIKEKNPLTSSPLYQTARKCREACAYELDIAEFGRYFVRLHFLAFKSGDTHLLDGLFNVSTSNKYLLLSNFGIQNSSNSPVIEEFLLTIDESKFRIYFVPVGASFAFVNAVEVFLAPPNLTTDDDAIHVWGKNGNYHGLLSHALHTVHRINVGGETKNDRLGRNWMSDDDDKYLIEPEPGLVKKCVNYSGSIDYARMEKGNVHIAPEFVYRTCKKLEVEDIEVSKFSNVTWRFNVRKNTRHLVRMHFCDNEEISVGLFRFNLSINTNFSHLVDPSWPQVSYYHDFVVDSDSSGFLRIGIVLDANSTKKKAILNGLEIMQLTEETSFIPHLSESKDYKLIIVSSVCSLASVACLVVIVLLCYKCKKPKNVRTVNSSHVVLWGVRIPRCKMTSETSSVSSLHNCNLKLKMAFSDILYATQNFDAKLLIGEGGFGKVYKGTLRSGLKVAVKRSDPNHGQGLPEFQTEIMILSKIRHRHLVSLVGYCDEGLEMILVYEFMEKGALKDHLYGSGNSEMISSTIPKLSWKQRLEICIGSARGLHYLHTGSAGGIIHRDIKSTNILLDEHYTAKVADFGLSRSGQLDPDHFSVGIKGSFGYLDPEYLTSLQFTEKSDVYSFGVVLLEVLCGRPAIVNTQRIEEVNLAEWGMYWQNKGQLETIMDPSLVGEISPNSLRKFGEIVENCLKRNGADRPAMIDVLWDLEYALQFQIAEFPREPLDGTTTTALLELPTLTGFPSYSIPDDEDELVLLQKSDG